MIIRNFGDLANTSRKKQALQILEAGMRAADPARIVPRFAGRGRIASERTYRVADYDAVHVLAFGKAAGTMAAAFDSGVRAASGLVVLPRGAPAGVRGPRFRVLRASHPDPDASSVRAAREALKFLRARRSGELVVFLVSGGGSSLLCLPDGVTLADKARAASLLMRAGAGIGELNCVRKHLSQVKGGRLVEGMECDGTALAISDVEGDDPAVIASGMTYGDDTTYADALDVVRRRRLEGRMPRGVMRVLREGAASGGAPGGGVGLTVMAGNASCTAAMASAARKMGYRAEVVHVFGEIKEAAGRIHGMMSGPGRCLVFGGETTTRVLGRGTGGRNHEMVLRLLKKSGGGQRAVIAAMGTDGVDGSSTYAGAITENRAADPGAIRDALRRSDSGGFFEARGASIRTGPTGTNLMDIGVVLQ
ncbi:Hydroxypyruvate reductase [Nitrosopumilaceae archaeon]|nr:DUF4147 domain-containing protein [Nitrosopumilus sp.]CAI9832522.1 Hydroxypyruvate reductase [Nitrosopumilaceae archaeon]MDA7941487.1 DUF4147 domain-containing protein [Nitrosopumilus sp.]MDA7943372.1 DUF4147 domain-containing protein [Nitrosopumilus sp.]MDA7944820.1 DUF4147 domain-containing protein [Nitrosopumilus sp.]